ncbi:hypothetical protein [Psychromonas sp. GE-S-Ul-11]|uniref:hypothetical protein n=1 Tax=Psychromonas sp. GE-S-Ul-11 TaxID=3241170 RepID=UPI00390CC955
MPANVNDSLKKLIVGVITAALLVSLSVGLYSGVSVSYLTVTGIALCPSVINIPACYIVSIGYFLMLIATLFERIKYSKWLFIIGWIPVVLLAVVGSLLEFFQGGVCPRSEMGTPLCYISLSFGVFVALLYWLKITKLNR